jgi:hypothetical protein
MGKLLKFTEEKKRAILGEAAPPQGQDLHAIASR